jgi:hypothetical protein
MLFVDGVSIASSSCWQAARRTWDDIVISRKPIWALDSSTGGIGLSKYDYIKFQAVF